MAQTANLIWTSSHCRTGARVSGWRSTCTEISLLTGAAGEGGFKGLGGLHSRRGLLKFGYSGIAGIAFRRLDTNATVDCFFRPNSVPADPRLGELLPTVIQGSANAAQTKLFGELWQDRVRRLLLDHVDDPAVVELRRLA